MLPKQWVCVRASACVLCIFAVHVPVCSCVCVCSAVLVCCVFAVFVCARVRMCVSWGVCARMCVCVLDRLNACYPTAYIHDDT